MGGPTDQMVSYFVALYTNRELNWGMASALGAILLAATLLLYCVYNKLVGVDRAEAGIGEWPFPPTPRRIERVWYITSTGLCGAVLLFLVAPILAIMPLSFNSVPFFSYPHAGPLVALVSGFLHLPIVGRARCSTRVIIACCHHGLGDGAGHVGSARSQPRTTAPTAALIMSLLISPIVVPVVITVDRHVLLLCRLVNLANTYLGLILAHTALATPFVVITVTATLTGFDHSLTRAAASLGASPALAFRQGHPAADPAGGDLGSAFRLRHFLGRGRGGAVPRRPASSAPCQLQMFAGIREEISPTITAAATLLLVLSIILLTSVELLRRRSARLRGLME